MQTTPSFEKQIQYDHGDYKMTLDGRVIGWAPTYSQAEVTLDEVVHEMLTHGDCATATELDAPVLEVNWNSASADPPPDDGPGHDEDGVPHAVTRQSLLIERTMRRCHNCGADHRTWACPEIARALFAPEGNGWKDIALGRELCRMRWKDFSAFVTLLKSVSATGDLTTYAESYLAFIRDHRPDSDMTIGQVMQAWGRIMSGESAPQLQAA